VIDFMKERAGNYSTISVSSFVIVPRSRLLSCISIANSTGLAPYLHPRLPPDHQTENDADSSTPANPSILICPAL